MKPKFTMILMLLALGVQMVFAQQKTVSGTVSDENGLPLPGATVIRAGTSSGTTTDFDGKYQLAVPAAAELSSIPVKMPYPLSETQNNSRNLGLVTSTPANMITKVWWDVN